MVPLVLSFLSLTFFHQNVDKLTLAIYNAAKAANNITLQNAIAAAMTGVSSDQVTNITVTPITAARTAHTHMRGFFDTESGCVVHYQVEVESDSHTFESLAAELKESAESGRMNQLLRYYATLYNTTAALGNCTMSVPTTTNLRPIVLIQSAPPTVAPTSNSFASIASDNLSGGALAGIIVGSIVFVAILLYIVYYCKTGSKRYQASSLKVVPISEDLGENIGDVMLTV